MHNPAGMTLTIVAVSFAMCGPTKACHETIHFTKAEVENANVRLYERDLGERNRDPISFDQKHGMVGDVLGNQQILAQELGAWRLHRGQFDHEHHGLWRVIDGDVLWHKRHPHEQSVIPLAPDWVPSAGGGDPPPSGRPSGGGPGNSIHPFATVPEPSSAALGMAALVVGTFAAIGRMGLAHIRRSRRTS